jgi:hypothetical protein
MVTQRETKRPVRPTKSNVSRARLHARARIGGGFYDEFTRAGVTSSGTIFILPVSLVSLVSSQQDADNKELLRRDPETSVRNRLVTRVSSLIQFNHSPVQPVDLWCRACERRCR